MIDKQTITAQDRFGIVYRISVITDTLIILVIGNSHSEQCESLPSALRRMADLIEVSDKI